jgi:glycosyltransferase involved in cell wall biosynthesis
MCLSTPPLFPYLGALARKRRGPRFVFLLYDLYPEVAVLMGLTREKSLSFRLLDRVYRTVFRKADRVVCLGRDVQGYLAETKGVGPDRAVLIPNWADPRKVVSTEPRHVFRREHGLVGKLMLVYSGNMGLFHDFDTLLDAAGVLQAEGVDDIVFVLVGRGDQRARVQKLQGERGLRNVVLGEFLPEADHYDLLASADLLLSTLKPGAGRFSVPSKTYPYLISGKPVVAIMDRSAEIAMTLDEEGVGYTIEPGRHDELAALLHEIRRHPEQLVVMGARAREAGLRRFSRGIVTLQYEEMFRTLDGIG